MEAMSANGGTDAAGGTNRDRSFDFNTFASELFNAITIRKTSAAEIEEGSLGATVDLRTARPFDYDGFTVVTGVQGGYNDISEEVDPRAASADQQYLAGGDSSARLLSVAYTERNCSMKDRARCAGRTRATRMPHRPTGTLNAGAAFGPLDPAYPATAPTLAQLNNAFRPRIPRYDIYEHEQERLGITGSLQWQAGERTLLTLDGLYATFDAKRSEVFLESPVFSTNGAAGMNNVNPRNAVIDGTNTIVYGRVQRRGHPFRGALRRARNRVHADHARCARMTSRMHGTCTGSSGYSEAKHDNPDSDDAAVRSGGCGWLQLRLSRQQPPAGDHLWQC